MPVIVAAVVFSCIFSAGPLVMPARFAKDDGRPDKFKWLMVAGGGGAAALLTMYAIRYMM